jgi:hypothetical protein
VSWINLVEVYYRVERDHGRPTADDTLASLRAALTLDLPGTARMIEAARRAMGAAAACASAIGVRRAQPSAAAELITLPTLPSWRRPSRLRSRDEPLRESWRPGRF